jgi:hypothetical protein
MATFFFDNDISFRIANALAQLVHCHDVISLRDRFPTNTPDTVWIPGAGRNGWIVVSRDPNQRRREAEKRALAANGVRVLYVKHSGTAATLYAAAARIIKNWPKIEAWGLSAKPGSLARLNTNDSIETL